MISRITLALWLSISAHCIAATNGVFPLMAWDDVYDVKTLEAMRDCGITCVAFVRPSMLDACHQLGIQAIVFDESVAGTNWTMPIRWRAGPQKPAGTD